MQFTICVLTFGDEHRLFRLCLSSIVACLDPGVVAELRLGLNAVSAGVRSVIEELSPFAVPVCTYEPNVACGKYQMMRAMLYDPAPAGEHIMWFDDDSFIRDARPNWFSRMAELASIAQLVGSVYRLQANVYTEAQKANVRAQPWYTGKEMGKNYSPRFVTGGWWIAEYASLRQWDYPFPSLFHNGGDVALGELARQQDWRVHPHSHTVAINADDNGRESRGKRRGLNTKPWGSHGAPNPVADVVFTVRRMIR